MLLEASAILSLQSSLYVPVSLVLSPTRSIFHIFELYAHLVKLTRTPAQAGTQPCTQNPACKRARTLYASYILEHSGYTTFILVQKSATAHKMAYHTELTVLDTHLSTRTQAPTFLIMSRIITNSTWMKIAVLSVNESTEFRMIGVRGTASLIISRSEYLPHHLFEHKDHPLPLSEIRAKRLTCLKHCFIEGTPNMEPFQLRYITVHFILPLSKNC